MKPASASYWASSACLLAGIMLPLVASGGETAASSPAPATSMNATPGSAALEKKTAPKKSRKKKTPKPPLAPPPEPTPTILPLVTEPIEAVLSVADAPRDYISEKFVGLINDIDRFFGSDRNYQENRDSVLQLDITRVAGYGGDHKTVFAGRARVRLPNTERRLHVLIESDPDKNATGDATRKQAVQTDTGTTPQSYGAGVRYEKPQDNRWRFSTDGGLKFQGLNTTPFARARASYGMQLDEWKLNAAETLFWFNTIGAGETTQIDLDRPISKPLLFRSTSNATWLNNTHNMSLRQDLTLFHTLDERTALLYQASAIGVSRPNTHVTDYVLLLSYRYRLHREWVYLDLSPQIHFPKERNFKPSGTLVMRLEFLFDKSR
jgi:hypothetical protein